MRLALAPREVVVRRAEGALYLSSPQPLREPPAPTLGALFVRSAEAHPERIFLLQGDRQITYFEARARAEGIARWLVAHGHTCVACLSGNSIEHALLMLGCFLAGVPFVPVSAAYSLMSKDFGKLRLVLDAVRPSVVFADRADWPSLHVAPGAITELPQHEEGSLPTVSADQLAKILFTSGSTGVPKGVPSPHRMLVANQQMIAQMWPFLGEEVLVDWLPWSHTFGGNHNLNLVLMHGATLLIDEGRPATFAATIANLKRLPPTLYFNVPAGFAALVPALEGDAAFRETFFSRLKVLFYAAAALPPDLWDRLKALAPPDVLVTSAWGSTETAPLATSAHFYESQSGNIGLPAPGVTLKLVPNGTKLEARVKGPNVMAGYLAPAECFDEEGFYAIGDAMKLADPEHPEQGLLFDGRVAEDFKLSSGTWVSVTFVRTGFLAHTAGRVADVVVCGHDRDDIRLLVWPAPTHPGLTEADLAPAIAAWNAENPGSSTRIAGVRILATPPSIDVGEITDKGYTNQRIARECRGADVAALYES